MELSETVKQRRTDNVMAQKKKRPKNDLQKHTHKKSE